MGKVSGQRPPWQVVEKRSRNFLSADFLKYWKLGQHSNITRTQAHLGTLTSVYDQNTRNKNSDNFIYKTDVQISGQGKTLFTYYNISNH